MKMALFLCCQLILVSSLLSAQEEASYQTGKADEKKQENISHKTDQQNIAAINVCTRILGAESQVLWEKDSGKKSIIPGRTIALNLRGSNLKLQLLIVPYPGNEEYIQLLLQSQIWLKYDQSGRFFSSIKTLKLFKNQPLYFYPLGKEEIRVSAQEPLIEIELQYDHQDKKNEKQAPSEKTTDKNPED